ncbi:hypothetical protein D3C78_1093470 [compost metagenome]
MENEPLTGMLAASSPRLVIRKYTIRPMTMKARSAPPGPAWAIVAPDATNSPVPMEPPMAIMFRCRGVRVRLRPPEVSVAFDALLFLEPDLSFGSIMGHLSNLRLHAFIFLILYRRHLWCRDNSMFEWD